MTLRKMWQYYNDVEERDSVKIAQALRCHWARTLRCGSWGEEKGKRI